MNEEYSFDRGNLTGPVYQLSDAVYANDLKAVKHILDGGLNVNAYDYEHGTALSWAADEGHLDLVKFLIERGANVNAVDDDGWAPLHDAVQSNHTEIVKVLLEHGADVSIAATETFAGFTPLMMARQHGNVGMMELLEKYGAKQQNLSH